MFLLISQVFSSHLFLRTMHSIQSFTRRLPVVTLIERCKHFSEYLIESRKIVQEKWNQEKRMVAEVRNANLCSTIAFKQYIEGVELSFISNRSERSIWTIATFVQNVQMTQQQLIKKYKMVLRSSSFWQLYDVNTVVSQRFRHLETLN